MNERTLGFDQSVGIVFDGDDTLWLTEALYDDARDHVRAIVVESGADGAKWEALQRRIDVENVSRLGYSPERFPTSCLEAYEQLRETDGRPLRLELRGLIRSAARSVFNRAAELVPDARETLSLLRADGIRMALLTKGDLAVQRRRIDDSGLAGYFDLIRIVSTKTPDDIQALVTELRVPKDGAWMVGNSIRSDVLPAIEAGIRAIWLRAHVWEYERAHDHLVDDRVVEVARIRDVPAAIAAAYACKRTELPVATGAPLG